MTARGKWQCAQGFFFIFLRMWEGQLDAGEEFRACCRIVSYFSTFFSFFLFSLRQNGSRRRRENSFVFVWRRFHCFTHSPSFPSKRGDIKFPSFFPPRTSLSPLFSSRSKKRKERIRHGIFSTWETTSCSTLNVELAISRSYLFAQRRRKAVSRKRKLNLKYIFSFKKISSLRECMRAQLNSHFLPPWWSSSIPAQVKDSWETVFITEEVNWYTHPSIHPKEEVGKYQGWLQTTSQKKEAKKGKD